MVIIAAGTKFGTADGGPPTSKNARELSRLHDTLKMVEQHCGKEAKLAVWKALPHQVKEDYLYSKWAYVPG